MTDQNQKCKKCFISTNNGFIPCHRDGNRQLGILFIGEAPGHTENKTKIPFTGKSGKLLRKFVDMYKLTDFSSFTNVIRCQPKYNRDPDEEEIENCKPYLFNDILEIKPTIIVLVGKIAIRQFIDKDLEFISHIVNKPVMLKDIVLFPIYHPSYIARENKDESYLDAFNKISQIYALYNRYYLPKTFKKK